MHEFALAEDIVKTIQSKVTADLKRVSNIYIEVGAFSGVVIDSLEFGLKIIMKEKNNDMVGINIIQVRTLARCECGREYEIKNIFESCPDCQSLTRKIISGTDVVIQSVEIREEPEKQPKKMARR
jgi:hydrogenase nickel incorporation protein HypA/HybF